MLKAFTPVEIDNLKRAAAKRKKTEGISHNAALDQEANKHGFANWSLLVRYSQKTAAQSRPDATLAEILAHSFDWRGSYLTYILCGEKANNDWAEGVISDEVMDGLMLFEYKTEGEQRALINGMNATVGWNRWVSLQDVSSRDAELARKAWFAKHRSSRATGAQSEFVVEVVYSSSAVESLESGNITDEVVECMVRHELASQDEVDAFWEGCVNGEASPEFVVLEQKDATLRKLISETSELQPRYYVVERSEAQIAARKSQQEISAKIRREYEESSRSEEDLVRAMFRLRNECPDLYSTRDEIASILDWGSVQAWLARAKPLNQRG